MRPALRSLGVLGTVVVTTACDVPARVTAAPNSAPAFDLGGGTASRAWHIVFVGDGYRTEDLAEYRARVDDYVAALIANPTGFVAVAPEAFHFHRVDVTGDGWYLGTQLDHTDSCGAPMIVADRELAGAAARNALAAPDAIVVIARDVVGRANADGNVHVSSRDSWQVLEHELSHALFQLGDEYAELQWCSARAPRSEAALLATPNVTSLDDPAKWAGDHDLTGSGGGRWPCLRHPSGVCTMLAADTGHYCSVCAASIREAIAARLCGDDARPPRVAVLDPPAALHGYRSGQVYTLEVAAFDESEVERFRFLVDGEVVADTRVPWAELTIDALAPGRHTLTVEAVDAAGNTGTSAPHALDIVHAVELAPRIDTLAVTADAHGWLAVSVRTSPPGGTLVLTHGAITRSFAIPVDAGASPLDLWLPGDPAASSLVATASTAHGVASPPVARDVTLPDPSGAEPVIEAVRVDGIHVASLAAIGALVELEVQVRTCAALLHVEVTDGLGKQLGAASLESSVGCQHVVRVVTAPTPGVLVIAATDRRGRRGTFELVAPPIVDAVSACAFDPRLDVAVVALAQPAVLALRPPGLSVSGVAVTVGGVRVPAFALTLPDGASAVLVAARDLPGTPEGTDVELRVTAVMPCREGLVAATALVPTVVDAVAPRLSVSRFTRGDAPLAVEAHDGASAVTVEELVAGARRVVRARDAAGNVTERALEPLVFPDPRAECPR